MKITFLIVHVILSLSKTQNRTVLGFPVKWGPRSDAVSVEVEAAGVAVSPAVRAHNVLIFEYCRRFTE